MRPGDPTLSNHPAADHPRAFERRCGVMGAIGAAGLIFIAFASAYSARPAQAVISDTDQSELTAFAKTLELSGLEIVF